MSSDKPQRGGGLTAGDLERFTEDLRVFAGLQADLRLDPTSSGMHVLQINGVEFFFYADGSGYDGWGQSVNHIT